jgi:hypothetical protein
MSDAAAALLPAPTPARRTFTRGLRDVVICSLLVTASAAVVATAIALPADLRWSLTFVIVRWLCVAALLATPLIHQAIVRLGGTWRMPWVLQTPATALVLTVESILLDILSARLG